MMHVHIYICMRKSTNHDVCDKKVSSILDISYTRFVNFLVHLNNQTTQVCLFRMKQSCITYNIDNIIIYEISSM